MGIGEFRHRIILKKVVISQDEIGNEQVQEVPLGSVWAKVSNLYGKEYYEAAAVQQEKMVSFLIRYNSQVDALTVIEFQGKSYNIIFVDNIKYGNKLMELKAELKPRQEGKK